jgi:peptidoglycan/LPS O-acetylase OafA/YrhL
MSYIKQLDAMRAIAILFVFCNHASTKGSLVHKASTIVSGPDIFFTISGFLITTILFKDKTTYDNNDITKSTIFKIFFAKRILRIFPAYYLTILVTYLINKDSVNNLAPFLNFTANFEISKAQDWGRLAHLWSMSVEQQFYLIWPFAIILTPRRLLPCTIGSFITIGLACHFLLPDSEYTEVLPYTCFDALGLGALLAWVVIYQPHSFTKAYQIFSFLALASGIIIVATASMTTQFLPFAVHRTLVSIITAWLISYFIYNKENEGGRLGFIFNNRLLIQFGKFSYGFYLFHITILYYSYNALLRFNKLLPFYSHISGSNIFYITENLLLITGLAWLSWKYFELPIYTLHKQFLPISKKERQVTPKLPARHAASVAAHQLTIVE